MNEDLESPISYSAADLHDATGRLLGEMMYYPPTADAMKSAWAPLLTRYLSGRDSEMVQRWLDNADQEGQIRRVLRNAVAKNIESPREKMPTWERRKELWAESGDYTGLWCNLPVFDNYVYRAIDKLLAQPSPPKKLINLTLDWLRINASVRGSAPSWRAKKLEALVPAAKEAAKPEKRRMSEIDAYRYFFECQLKTPPAGKHDDHVEALAGSPFLCERKDGSTFEVGKAGKVKKQTDTRAFSAAEIEARLAGIKERKPALSPLLAAPYSSSENHEETPMKTKFDSKTFAASLLASLTATATVQGGNAGLTAIKQLTLKLLPIKWGFWARVTGKHKKVAEHPLTTLAVTVGLNALVHATTEENSKLRVISQSLQTAAVLEAVNGVGEIKNVVHSLLEPSQTDAE